MVEQKKGTTILTHLQIVLGAISASMFVGKSEGKLRDYYRIGKILGTGTYFNGVLTASGHTQT